MGEPIRLDETKQPPTGSAPPRGPRARVILLVLLAAILGVWAGVHWSGPLSKLGQKVWFSAGQSHPEDNHKHWYTCGMHPWVILPRPGNCPICHMQLTPVDAEALAGGMSISPLMTQNIGVRVAPVVTGPIERVIRTVGSVDFDETRLREVTLKVGGWVQKLHVDSLGAVVEKGQPLLEIYSPELYSAQQEYLTARSRSSPAGATESADWQNDLLTSARKRLENFDISPEQIRQLEQSGKPAKTMTLASPYRGTVIAKNVLEGQKVEPGMQLYRLADLSTVWILVTLYEYQLPFVQLGQQAAMTLPYIPGKTFSGKVAYIYPTVNPQTRQVNVRLEFDNPDGLLKPGMFASVELRGTLADRRVLVPREAVIDTGDRQVAFVSLGQGRFLPRTVRLGVEAADGKVEILDGLKPGEMVVTSGNFLLDSETRFREALAKMIRGEQAAEQKVQAAASGKAELTALPENTAKAIQGVLENYFAIGEELSRDSVAGLASPAEALAAGIDRLIATEIPSNEHFWHQHTETADIRGKALEMLQAKDLVQARQLFADLSIAMTKLLQATGVPSTFGREVQELHCPMYRPGQGGTWWLQPAGPTRNPYFGKAMLECQDKQASLPVTTARSAASSPASPTTTEAARP